MNSIRVPTYLFLCVVAAVVAISVQDDASGQQYVPPAFSGRHLSVEPRGLGDASAGERFSQAGMGYGELSRYQGEVFRALEMGEAVRVDSLRLLAVMVEFADLGFDSERHDSLYFANELRHLAEYYRGASRGRFSLLWHLEGRVVRLKKAESYYGEDGVWDERVLEILGAVVDSLDDEVDFSQYDAFAVIHAGAGQETDFNSDSPWQLWSGFLKPETIRRLLADSLGTPGVPTNDTVEGDTFYVDNLILVPETASQDGMTFGALGIYAYELGYRLGMFPLFDTTPQGYPDSQGIGVFGLMSYGLYNANGFVPAFPCAFHRYLLGWADAVQIGEPREVNLVDINSQVADTTLVRIPISSTEYFLLANRVHDTNFNGTFDFVDLNGDGIPGNEDTLLGAEFDYFLTKPTNPEGETGSGLMIWHIDEGVIASALAAGRYPEDDRDRKGVDLEEADGIQDLDRPGGGYAFGSYLDSFRRGNNDHFGPYTDPSSSNNNGVATGIDVRDISDAAHVMGFRVDFLEMDGVSRIEVSGELGGVSVVPFSPVEGSPESLYVVTDSGMILRFNEAWGEGFGSDVDTLFSPGSEVAFEAPPVFADLDGMGGCELLLVCGDSVLAFYRSGEPFPIDEDDSYGVLETGYESLSSPVVTELDGDSGEEAVLVGTRGDTLFLLVIGSQHHYSASGLRHLGPYAEEYFLGVGSLVSSLSVMEKDAGEIIGVCFVSTLDGTAAILDFVPLVEGSVPVELLGRESERLCVRVGTDRILGPAVGDIDGDGDDDVVFSTVDGSIVFVASGVDCVEIPLEGSHPSSCVLADMNADGILETLLMDDERAYLFTGFGTLVSGWPRIFLPSGLDGLKGSHPVEPVAFDVDGDHIPEALFNIKGDIYVLDYRGRTLDGWPKVGESGLYSYQAILSAGGGTFYLFTTGYVPETVRSMDGQVSFIRRIRLDAESSGSGAWRFARHDRRGTSRQERSKATVYKSEHIDSGSLMCYPNPVGENVLNVRLSLHSAASVKVRILTLEGEEVYSAYASHVWPEGSDVPFELAVPVGKLSGGIYICLVEVEGEGWSWRGSKKFAVVR